MCSNFGCGGDFGLPPTEHCAFIIAQSSVKKNITCSRKPIRFAHASVCFKWRICKAVAPLGSVPVAVISIQSGRKSFKQQLCSTMRHRDALGANQLPTTQSKKPTVFLQILHLLPFHLLPSSLPISVHVQTKAVVGYCLTTRFQSKRNKT